MWLLLFQRSCKVAAWGLLENITHIYMHMYTFDSRNAYTNMWVHKFYSRIFVCTYICMCSLTPLCGSCLSFKYWSTVYVKWSNTVVQHTWHEIQPLGGLSLAIVSAQSNWVGPAGCKMQKYLVPDEVYTYVLRIYACACGHMYGQIDRQIDGLMYIFSCTCSEQLRRPCRV